MTPKCLPCRSPLLGDRQRNLLKSNEMPVMPSMPVINARAHVRVFNVLIPRCVLDRLKIFPCEAKTWTA